MSKLIYQLIAINTKPQSIVNQMPAHQCSWAGPQITQRHMIDISDCLE